MLVTKIHWLVHLIGNGWRFALTAFQATVVSLEIALIGAVISYLQLRYMRRRDRDLDVRDSWAETHKLMIVFRFKREILNMPRVGGPSTERYAVEALESLHLLKGQVDRMADSAKVEALADFLHENILAEQWRSPDFVTKFDEFAREAARLSQPPPQT